MIEMLRTELHCHNIYSNGHVGELEPPCDCNVTISEQLQKSLDSKLDVLFVTNHNTLDGFKQMTDYKTNHEKFSNLKIFPAEEITTDKEAHVLVYGLHEEIKPNQTIDEILDAAKSQDAVTIAPHPFSLIDALRDELQDKTGKQVFIDIHEIKNPNTEAQLISENVAFQHIQ